MNAAAVRPNSLLRRWDGVLTQDLALRPGEFGLGKVPARLDPHEAFLSTLATFRVNASLDTGHPEIVKF